MFDKMTTFIVGRDDVEILDGDLLKTAALKLPNGVSYDPDFFYMKVRAVSAGEYWGCNKNFDFFPEHELLHSHQTFLTAHTFKNHENKDIKNAIGDVLTSDWNNKMKSVELLLRIDRKIAPTIVRGFEKGFMTDVSMGCRISHSVCSICGNKAKTKYEYCDHIKSQRGQILEDGRKVYEINIGPKFHDISAVLNGAERSAKALGLMIVGNKVAFEEETTLEKCASLQDSINSIFKEDHSDKGTIRKVASEIDTIDLDMNMYKRMDKKAYVQKIAEIKKEIQGKMVGVAKGNYILERKENAEQMSSLLKMLYENYWNREKCYEIAKKIKYFASQKGVPMEVAFDQFIKVLNFAGIELSPLELHDIASSLMKSATPDLRGFRLSKGEINNEEACGLSSDMDTIIRDNSMADKMNLSTLFKTINEVFLPNQSKIIEAINPALGDPVAKTKAIIILSQKSAPSVQDDVLQDDMMRHVVKPLLSERSMHRKFLIPRLMQLINEDLHPHAENINHFMPAKMLSNGTSITKVAASLPYTLSGLLYSTYQDERVASCMNGELLDGISKFAGDIYEEEQSALYKTAGKKWGAGKAIFIGIPATYAYSGVQRARINNGNKVSTLNRFVAENPGNAALLQVAFTPAIAKAIKGASKTNKGGTEVVDEYLYKKFALHQNYGSQEKVALFDNNNDSLYNKDMFKDESIDREMLKNYSREQINVIKEACVLTAEQKQDSANDILFKHALREEDLAQYLKTAVDCIKIDIEKSADTEMGKQMTAGVMSDMLFNPKGISALAAFPGNIIDSYVFSKLFNKAKQQGKNAGRIDAESVVTPTL